MKVIRKRPGEDAEIAEVENDLHALQKEVGGYIQFVPLATDFGFILNEEGKLLGLEPNVFFGSDLIVGTLLGVGLSGEEFCDVSRLAVDMIKRWLNQEEMPGEELLA